MKKYFNIAFLDFYKELSKNNNKEWFHDHKEVYEVSVKHPFNCFVEDFIKETSVINSNIQLEASDSIFRINRDMRFAKALPIYKNFSSALISEGNKRSKDIPGFYFEFGVECVKVSGGLFKAKKVEVISRTQALKEHQLSEDFKSMYGDVQFNESIGFVSYETQLLPDFILSEDLLSVLIEYWRTGQEVNSILHQNVI